MQLEIPTYYIIMIDCLTEFAQRAHFIIMGELIVSCHRFSYILHITFFFFFVRCRVSSSRITLSNMENCKWTLIYHEFMHKILRIHFGLEVPPPLLCYEIIPKILPLSSVYFRDLFFFSSFFFLFSISSLQGNGAPSSISDHFLFS